MRGFLVCPLVVVLLLLQCAYGVHSAGQRRFLTGIDHGVNPASSVLDDTGSLGVFIVKPSSENWPRRDLNLRSTSSCDETYGFMPCTATAVGNLFLMAVYGYLLYFSATLLTDGSELLLSVVGPGIIGGLILPILGALPDALLVLSKLIFLFSLRFQLLRILCY